ncbi:hypothetical protein L249_2626 [Ophiocordyceps polyrhachis-furcata BCC 54312]|uniref:Uncharacterized protein n=1 Tax=Ophiocordyceps polyrhachis-furcata BCC 54312 TaxID=1330021 RepID=A0A367LNV4_9HYPO|nr:hypothetical protein L249_2626 [Ophiocordyceps polyrhachis-furcata BCC 54312]
MDKNDNNNNHSESPPPERQSGAQLHEPPASGQGIVDKSEKAGGDQVKGLSSNPQGSDEVVKQKFS